MSPSCGQIKDMFSGEKPPCQAHLNAFIYKHLTQSNIQNMDYLIFAKIIIFKENRHFHSFNSLILILLVTKSLLILAQLLQSFARPRGLWCGHHLLGSSSHQFCVEARFCPLSRSFLTSTDKENMFTLDHFPLWYRRAAENPAGQFLYYMPRQDTRGKGHTFTEQKHKSTWYS